MARSPIRRRRPLRLSAEISLTPLIDTALTLLIIFMVTTPMLHNAIKVNLPEGKSKETGNENPEMVVYLTDNGSVFFNGVPVNQDNLIATVQSAMKKSTAQKPVFVKADTLVQYGKVIQVVDQLKVVGGIEYVALATKKA